MKRARGIGFDLLSRVGSVVRFLHGHNGARVLSGPDLRHTQA
jgi:hypothetical protein